jgi:hypothetical protein
MSETRLLRCGRYTSREGDCKGVQGALPAVRPALTARSRWVQAHEGQIDTLQGRLLVGEMTSSLDRLADAGVHALKCSTNFRRSPSSVPARVAQTTKPQVRMVETSGLEPPTPCVQSVVMHLYHVNCRMLPSTEDKKVLVSGQDVLGSLPPCSPGYTGVHWCSGANLSRILSRRSRCSARRRRWIPPGSHPSEGYRADRVAASFRTSRVSPTLTAIGATPPPRQPRPVGTGQAARTGRGDGVDDGSRR